MKGNICLLVLSFLLLFSCTEKREGKVINNNKNETILFKDNSNLTKNNLNGFWIRTDYIKLLKETNSPLESFSGLEGCSALLIKDTNAYISFNNTEIIDATIEKKEILIDWNGKKTSKVINLDNNKITFSLDKQYSFIRINDFEEEDIEKGIQYVVFKELLKGKKYDVYSLGELESTLLFESVSFENDGTVLNFLNYDYYEIQTSFETDPNPKDLIIFKTTNSTSFYNFSFINNDINLYEADFTEEEKDSLTKEKSGYFLKCTVGGNG